MTEDIPKVSSLLTPNGWKNEPNLHLCCSLSSAVTQCTGCYGCAEGWSQIREEVGRVSRRRHLQQASARWRKQTFQMNLIGCENAWKHWAWLVWRTMHVIKLEQGIWWQQWGRELGYLKINRRFRYSKLCLLKLKKKTSGKRESSQRPSLSKFLHYTTSAPNFPPPSHLCHNVPLQSRPLGLELNERQKKCMVNDSGGRCLLTFNFSINLKRLCFYFYWNCHTYPEELKLCQREKITHWILGYSYFNC